MDRDILTQPDAGADAASRQDKATGSSRRQWQILAVVLVGSFIAVLDTTIVCALVLPKRLGSERAAENA